MLIERLTSDLAANLAEVFRALADPSRVRILHALQAGETCVGDLASELGISESAASQHLRLLRQLRLVRGRRDGKMVYYQLDDDHVRVLLEVCLEHLDHTGKRDG